MMSPRVLGMLVAVVVLVAGIVLYTTGATAPPTPTPVPTPVTTPTPAATPTPSIRQMRAVISPDKAGFMNNLKVKQILRTRYYMEIIHKVEGSLEMVGRDRSARSITPVAAGTPAPEAYDFLWPSNDASLGRYQANGGGYVVHEYSIFQTALVFYTHDLLANKLLERGLVVKDGDTLYFTEAGQHQLIEMILARKPWSEALGTGDSLYGNVNVTTADPLRSGSGLMFASLVLADRLGNDFPHNHIVVQRMEPVTRVINRNNALETNTGTLLQRFLASGVAAYPIIVGYENQLIEYSIANKESLPVIKQKLRVIYPRPTLFVSHPMTALTEAGHDFADHMFKDAELRRIAWEEHGFRTGQIGVTNSRSVIETLGIGIPDEVKGVTTMPNNDIMLLVLQAFGYTGK